MEKSTEINILILESDSNISHLIKDYLVKNGYQVLLAASSKQAVDILKQYRPELAFIGDPPEGGSCFDMLKPLVKASPMTYLVLITDESEKDIHEKAEGFGILGHVPKSLNPSHIESIIEKYRKITQAL